MTRAAPALLLLAAPAVLAFFTGGYFDRARLTAGLVALAAAALAALLAPDPLPRSRAGRLALGGLAALAALQLASVAWAPLRGPALDDGTRSVLYLAALLVAAAVLRGPGARAAEPVLLAGIVAVVAYGLSERLLPGLVTLERSQSAFGRLEQPLSYWNAMGALAAIGLVLGLRLAGDGTRGPVGRALGAASAPLLGAGVLLAFSRGALLAAGVGVLVLAVVARDGGQARALLAGLLAAGLAGAAAALLPAVGTLEGSPRDRGLQGAALLVWLVLLSAGSAALARRRTRAIRRERTPPRWIAAALVAVLAVLVVLAAGVDGGTPPEDGATAARLTSTASNRYAYWDVALSAWAREPVHGIGSGAFATEWLRERTIDDTVRDAHSWPIETLAELGLLGVLALAALATGVALAAARALRADPTLAAGPVAAVAAWAAHAAIDWDWEMPALTLVAVGLAGLLVGAADPPGGARRRAPRRATRAGLALACVALAVPLATELRAERLSQEAVDAIFAGESPSLRRERALLRRARALTIDSRPDLIEAELLIDADRPREAVPLLEAVVGEEPANARAWAQLSLALRPADPRRAAAARARALALAPRPG